MRRYSVRRHAPDRRLENETWEISRKMNDVLARAARDFEDDTLRRQDIAKDVENEIAITHGRRRVLAMIGHLPHTFDSTWLELCLAMRLSQVHPPFN